MSTKINIDNYESFYLDYLEGNLGESDTAALFAFLEENPDLVVEDDSLVYLPEMEFIGLDSQSKSSLKFPDTDQKIGLNNIEIFLIASVEQQLSAEKSNELQAFLKANPFYAEELTLYQRSRLQADLSIVFPEKRSLKKGGVIIPMYARFAAAAASVILVVGLLNFSQHEPTNLAAVGKEGKEVRLKPVHSGKAPAKNDSQEVVHHSAAALGAGTEKPATVHVAQATVPAATTTTVIRHQDYTRLKAKPVKAITNTSRPLLTELPLAYVKPFAPESDVPVLEGFAMVEMKNPIKPITNRISEVLKKDVDFRTSKAARKKTGGFYLKIGKFEISRKVYDNTSVAANQ